MLFKEFVINIACPLSLVPCPGKYLGGLEARLGRADGPLNSHTDFDQISYSYQGHAHMLILLNFGPI